MKREGEGVVGDGLTCFRFFMRLGMSTGWWSVLALRCGAVLGAGVGEVAAGGC